MLLDWPPFSAGRERALSMDARRQTCGGNGVFPPGLKNLIKFGVLTNTHMKMSIFFIQFWIWIWTTRQLHFIWKLVQTVQIDDWGSSATLTSSPSLIHQLQFVWNWCKLFLKNRYSNGHGITSWVGFILVDICGFSITLISFFSQSLP